MAVCASAECGSKGSKGPSLDRGGGRHMGAFEERGASASHPVPPRLKEVTRAK